MRHFGQLIVVLFLLSAGIIAMAQTATTSVRGVVTDRAGAVVGNVQIVLTEHAIGFTQTHRTNGGGEYSFQQIPPGSYQIKASSPGFTDQTTSAQLLVNQPATINISLVIGAGETTVEVTAESAAFNATDATIGMPFNQTTIQSLPFQGNNVFSLLSLQAGVLTLGDQSQTTMDADSRAGAVNGARSDQGNLTLDGIDNNTQTQGYAFTGVLRPTRDSVDEFRVVTTSSNADSGRSSGAQVSVVTRSGTNNLHGGAYEYYRPSNTIANDWFIKQAEAANGQPNVPGKYIRNTFGASLGGRIIPDKLFYFGSYEADKIAQNRQVTDEVPTAGLRKGNVTYVDANGKLTTLTPGVIAQMDPNCSSLGTCPLGAGVDPAALAYFATLPAANGNLLGDGYNFGSYTFSSPNSQSNITNLVKLDYNLNARQRLFLRGNLQSDNQLGVVQYPGSAPSTTHFDNSRGLGFGHTWAITDSLVNSLHYGYIRQGFANRGSLKGNYVTFANITPTSAKTYDQIVNVPLHNLVDDLSWTKKTHTYQIGVNYRLVHNNRQSNSTAYNNAQVQYYSLGAGAIANTGNSLDPGAFPNLGIQPVSADFSSAYSDAIAAVAGVIPTATEYFNYKVSGNRLIELAPGELSRSYKSNEFEIYVQDSWKVTRDLTLTYGLRYTSLQTPYEVNGQEVSPTINMHQWFLQRGTDMAKGTTTQPQISFGAAGHANNAPGLWAKDKADLAPRLAIAYSPTRLSGFLGQVFGEGKTSIRAGWGIYYDHFGQGIVDSFDANGAYGLSSRVNSPIDLTPDQAPRFSSTGSVPTQIIPPTAPESSFPVTPGNIEALTWTVDNRVKTPYAQAMDFSIERQVSKSWTVEAAYVGRLGRRLLQNLDLATPLDLVDTKSGLDWFRAAQLMSTARVANVSTGSLAPIPYFENMFPEAAGNGNTATQNIYNDLWTAGTVGNETFPLYSLDLGYYPGSPAGATNRFFDGQYASVYAWSSVGSSSYHSLQLSAHHQMSHGLQFDLDYTLGKSIDTGSDSERTDFNKGQNFSSIVNAWNIKGNRGVSDFDTRHAISVDGDYRLPFGRGASFVNGGNRFIGAIVSNWNLSGLAHWTSGLPFSGVDGAGWSTDWAVQSFARVTGKVSSGGHRTLNGQPNAFQSQTRALANVTAPFAGQSGQRNSFRGDGYFSIDSSVARAFPIMESQSLKFQWDVFNSTNSVRFDPASVQSNPFSAASFGVYSRQLVEARRMQFSLRYSF